MKIVDGLTKKDAIAFPTDSLEEGEKTEVGDLAQTMSGGADGITDMDADYGNMDDAQIRFHRYGIRRRQLYRAGYGGRFRRRADDSSEDIDRSE